MHALKRLFHTLFVQGNNRSLISQLVRFAIVGSLGFVVDISVFALLERGVGLHYALANLLSFGVAVVFNWYLSRRWVFASSKIASPKLEGVFFIALAVIGLGINELVLWIGIDLWGRDSIAIKSAATVIAAVWNFVIRKLVLYK